MYLVRGTSYTCTNTLHTLLDLSLYRHRTNPLATDTSGDKSSMHFVPRMLGCIESTMYDVHSSRYYVHICMYISTSMVHRTRTSYIVPCTLYEYDVHISMYEYIVCRWSLGDGRAHAHAHARTRAHIYIYIIYYNICTGTMYPCT